MVLLRYNSHVQFTHWRNPLQWFLAYSPTGVQPSARWTLERFIERFKRKAKPISGPSSFPSNLAAPWPTSRKQTTALLSGTNGGVCTQFMVFFYHARREKERAKSALPVWDSLQLLTHLRSSVVNYKVIRLEIFQESNC